MPLSTSLKYHVPRPLEEQYFRQRFVKLFEKYFQQNHYRGAMFTFMKKVKLGVNKFRSLLPIYGFWGAVGQVQHNVLLIEVMYRFEKDLRLPEERTVPKVPLQVTPLQGDVNFEQWGIREAVLKIRGEYGMDQFKERLANGDVMFCACSNEKIAGFIWLNGFPVKGAGYKLKDDEAYHIDGWTFDAYRGKAVLPVLQQTVFNYVRSHYPRVRFLIGHASVWNKPSIIGQQRAGLVLVARELSIVFFGHNRKFHLNTIHKPIA